MKKASFARVDERLIHGQVMTAWVKKYWIKKIILVDDEIVQDSFMQEVLSMSAPQGVKVEVRSAADAAAELGEDTSDDNVMLLFKELKYAGLLVNYGYPLEELDIGNIGSAPGRKAITKEGISPTPRRISSADSMRRTSMSIFRSFPRTLR